jgi:hypothetical protein
LQFQDANLGKRFDELVLLVQSSRPVIRPRHVG